MSHFLLSFCSCLACASSLLLAPHLMAADPDPLPSSHFYFLTHSFSHPVKFSPSIHFCSCFFGTCCIVAGVTQRLASLRFSNLQLGCTFQQRGSTVRSSLDGWKKKLGRKINSCWSRLLSCISMGEPGLDGSMGDRSISMLLLSEAKREGQGGCPPTLRRMAVVCLESNHGAVIKG